MRLFIGVIIWVAVFLICPVVALAALILYPVAWLISLPFRLLGLCTDAIFVFLKAVLFLPARILGARPSIKVRSS